MARSAAAGTGRLSRLLVIVLAVSPAALAFPAEAARPRGVTVEIERGISSGLDYLVKTQNADGSWSNLGGWGRFPTAMTGLCGMALLASGSTVTTGPRAAAVRKAVDFLVQVARPTGLIATTAEEGRSMHGHGFAILFLAEAYGNEEDRRRQRQIHDVLARAVRITERSQSRAGGWLYTPDQESDEGSVTVTQIQGLRACRNAGIYVSPATIRRAVGYIERSANPDGGIRYNLSGGGESRPAITAAAVATLYNAGEYDSPMAHRAMAFCDKAISITSGEGAFWGHYFYSHLYLSQAKYQRGGRDWDEYYRVMSGKLLSLQQDGGSWMGDEVGTSYGTAVALIILQLPYGLVSIYQR
jgi:hypothetical protein